MVQLLLNGILRVMFGLFIFINKNDHTEKLRKHEYGHTIQSLILGPLWIFVIGLPSLIWCSCFEKYRRKPDYLC